MQIISLSDEQIKEHVTSNNWGEYLMHTVTPIQGMLVYEIWTYSKKQKEYATRFLVIKRKQVTAFDDFSSFALINLPPTHHGFQLLLFAMAELAVIGMAWQTHDFYLYSIIGGIVSGGVLLFFKRG
jgi:hypothetical protein